MGVKDVLAKALCQYLTKKNKLSNITDKGFTRAVIDISGWLHDAAATIAEFVLKDDHAAAIRGCTSILGRRIGTTMLTASPLARS